MQHNSSFEYVRYPCSCCHIINRGDKQHVWQICKKMILYAVNGVYQLRKKNMEYIKLSIILRFLGKGYAQSSYMLVKEKKEMRPQASATLLAIL